jgi:hypothetical protein
LRLTIYSKPGCHLCDDMKSLVRRVVSQSSGGDIAIDEVDIAGDRDLLDRYGLEIPVLLIDGKKVAKYRVSEDELRKMLFVRGGSGGK